MRLSTRVLMTTVLVAVPVVTVFAWMERRSRFQLVESSVTSALQTHLDADAIASCNAHPESWSARFAPHAPGFGRRAAGSPGRAHGLGGIVVYAYDKDVRPLDHRAPRVDPALVAGLGSGDIVTSQATTDAGRPAIEALIRLDSSGACRYALARRPVPWVMVRGLLDTRGLLTWVLPSLSIVLAVGLAMGAVARRVRRLTANVIATTGQAFAGLSIPKGDDEISDLARAFVAAGQELRAHMDALAAKEQALREFVANTTHDVMIPLTVLQGHLAELASTEVRTAPHGRDSDGGLARNPELAGALREAYYIGALLKNLSIAARLDSAEPGLEEGLFDLRDLVQRVIERHIPVARGQGIELVHSVPAEATMVMADALMLEQALGNVVFNAIRHNREGGHVAVIVETEARRFLVRVIDDGPGVTDTELPHLTERHFRSEASRTRRSGGMGLGLDITRRVVERHGYRLDFAHSEYGGLEVSLRGQLVSQLDAALE